MVVKNITFVCQNCGAITPKWLGRCNECSSWNSFVEEVIEPRSLKSDKIVVDDPILLKEIQAHPEERIKIDIEEFDRVLGGGIVLGSVVLIGGDPGIGKSTLALQVSSKLSAKGKTVLYISGEESVLQTKLRADRLGNVDSGNLYIISQVQLEVIVECIKKVSPSVVIIDSIQVLFSDEMSSGPGSVSQVRCCASQLTRLAKEKDISMFIIGHVTKEGALAGPRVLEHIVDTVIYFEGEHNSMYRILRVVKNRFGSTNEIGVFEMESSGLIEVKNPSSIFLSERVANTSGSAVIPSIEGSRPILVEIQALAMRSNLALSRRRCQGFDYNRLNLLLAVIERRLGFKLITEDIFVNVVGGIKIDDPAADLTVIAAIISSLKDKPIDHSCVLMGEVGLGAEVRSVTQSALRIQEAEKLGFKKCILPKNNLTILKKVKKFDNIQLLGVESVKDVINLIWEENKK